MPMQLNTDASIDQHNNDAALQALLAQQENLQAKIESLLNSRATSTTRHNRSPIRKHRNDFSMPRSNSFSSSPMSRQLSDRGSYHGRMQRTGSGNALRQSAPGMSRTRSNLSGGSPFTSNGPTVPIPHFAPVQRDTSILDNWTTSGDDPVNEYTFGQAPTLIRNNFSSQKPNVGEDIDNYLSRTSGSSNAIHIQNNHLPGQRHLDLPVSTQYMGLHSPVSMYDEALTNDSTLSSEMSRQSSISDEGLMNGFEMIHVDSATPSFSDGDDDVFSFTRSGHPCSSEEQKQLLLGAGGVSQASLCSPFMAGEGDRLYPSPTLHLESMQRSASNESTSSTSSSRSKLQLQKQIQLANARPLAAKPVVGDLEMSREPSSQSLMRVPSEQGLEERRVQAIPKAAYQRPMHPKVWCKKCDEYPDGFRGEHELRRHTDRQHKVVVKKWVCSEPTDGLIGAEHPVPTNPLSKCKSCSQLKKKYGAYYNAAAHLRRAHFNPKPKGRGKGAKLDGKVTEKRGGKGGGDWPSMGELKRWMMQVDELVMENEQQPDQDEESDGDYMNVEYSDGPMLLPNVSPNSAPLITSNFLTENQHMLNAYPTTMINHDNSQTQNIHIGMNMQPSLHHVLAMQNQNIDASAMFFDVQNGLLMADDMNDLSFSSLSSSFPSDLEQQHQQQQQQWSFR